jgi:hypothetical protein
MAAEIKELKNELNRITDLLKLAVKNMYGKSSEKICIDCYDQLSFLGDDEAEKSELPKPPKTVVNSHVRAEKRSYAEMYGDLPADVIEYDVDDKACEKCGSEMVQIGYDSLTAHIHICRRNIYFRRLKNQHFSLPPIVISANSTSLPSASSSNRSSQYLRLLRFIPLSALHTRWLFPLPLNFCTISAHFSALLILFPPISMLFLFILSCG